MANPRYNPLGLELAKDIYTPYELDPNTREPMILAFAGEILTEELIHMLRLAGYDDLPVRIFPSPPVNRDSQTEEEWMMWYDGALEELNDYLN